jgi:threonine dehydrogenase-like Zn-dependent dehydrogenase
VAGRVVIVGMGADEVRLPLFYVQDRELTITGAFRYASTWPTAIRVTADGCTVLRLTGTTIAPRPAGTDHRRETLRQPAVRR